MMLCSALHNSLSLKGVSLGVLSDHVSLLGSPPKCQLRVGVIFQPSQFQKGVGCGERTLPSFSRLMQPLIKKDVSDFFFFSLGGGEGGVRGDREGGLRFFIENPRRGGGPTRGGGGERAGRVSAGKERRGGKYFFFGAKMPAKLFKKAAPAHLICSVQHLDANAIQACVEHLSACECKSVWA